jgi:hypothetical protein
MAKRLYKLGSLATDTRTGLKSIFVSGTKDLFDTLQQPLGTDYQVPPATVFYITALIFHADTAKTLIHIGYGDDAVNASAVPPTNPVYVSPFYNAAVVDVHNHHECFYEIPAGKYPFIECLVGAGVAEVQGLQI